MDEYNPTVRFNVTTSFMLSTAERDAMKVHATKKDGSMSKWLERIAKEAYEKEKADGEATV